jgi:hypothetical protein
MSNTMYKNAPFEIGGVAHMKLTVPYAQAHLAIIKGMTGNVDGRTPAPLLEQQEGEDYIFEAYLHNAFVNQGLRAVLDSAYGDLTADRITHIALSGDNGAVTVNTTDIDPSGSGFSPKVTANTARTNQTVSTDSTWTQADVSFAIRKIGLLTGTAKTNAVNIIGGSGSAPYNEPFNIDLTTIATFSLQMGIDVTAAAT